MGAEVVPEAADDVGTVVGTASTGEVDCVGEAALVVGVAEAADATLAIALMDELTAELKGETPVQPAKIIATITKDVAVNLLTFIKPCPPGLLTPAFLRIFSHQPLV